MPFWEICRDEIFIAGTADSGVDVDGA